MTRNNVIVGKGRRLATMSVMNQDHGASVHSLIFGDVMENSEPVQRPCTESDIFEYELDAETLRRQTDAWLYLFDYKESSLKIPPEEFGMKFLLEFRRVILKNPARLSACLSALSEMRTYATIRTEVYRIVDPRTSGLRDIATVNMALAATVRAFEKDSGGRQRAETAV